MSFAGYYIEKEYLDIMSVQMKLVLPGRMTEIDGPLRKN